MSDTSPSHIETTSIEPGETETFRDEASAEAREAMKRLSRKSFIWAGVVVLAGYGGIRLMNSRREVDGIVWPLRVALEANEQLQRDLYAYRLAPTFDPAFSREKRLPMQ